MCQPRTHSNTLVSVFVCVFIYICFLCHLNCLVGVLAELIAYPKRATTGTALTTTPQQMACIITWAPVLVPLCVSMCVCVCAALRLSPKMLGSSGSPSWWPLSRLINCYNKYVKLTHTHTQTQTSAHTQAHEGGAFGIVFCLRFEMLNSASSLFDIHRFAKQLPWLRISVSEESFKCFTQHLFLKTCPRKNSSISWILKELITLSLNNCETSEPC